MYLSFLAGGVSFKDFIGSGATAADPSGTGIVGIIDTVVVPTIFALAFLMFVYGMVKYFFIEGAEAKKREEGRMFILWGVVGMVVLFSVWGLLNILLSTLGLDAG